LVVKLKMTLVERAFRFARRKATRFYHHAASMVCKPNQHAVIVLGNQKSGTTAIAALLALHTDSSVALDLPGIHGSLKVRMKSGEVPFQRFLRGNASELSRDIIKEPNLTFFYHELKEAFPDARYLMIVRDPRQNIRSILNRLNLPGNLESLDDETIASIPRIWRVDIEGRWLGLLGTNYVEILAARWNLAADVYLKHRREMLLVRYEDFDAAKAAVIADLARRLHLPAVRNVSAAVDTQYQNRGNRMLPLEVFFGPENLARIVSICSERMSEFGYSA
jgi:hypothetical protein